MRRGLTKEMPTKLEGVLCVARARVLGNAASDKLIFPHRLTDFGQSNLKLQIRPFFITTANPSLISTRFPSTPRALVEGMPNDGVPCGNLAAVSVHLAHKARRTERVQEMIGRRHHPQGMLIELLDDLLSGCHGSREYRAPTEKNFNDRRSKTAADVMGPPTSGGPDPYTPDRVSDTTSRETAKAPSR